MEIKKAIRNILDVVFDMTNCGVECNAKYRLTISKDIIYVDYTRCRCLTFNDSANGEFTYLKI